LDLGNVEKGEAVHFLHRARGLYSDLQVMLLSGEGERERERCQGGGVKRGR